MPRKHTLFLLVNCCSIADVEKAKDVIFVRVVMVVVVVGGGGHSEWNISE